MTILDLPELMAVLREAIDAVPAWERAALQERLYLIRERALEHRTLFGDPLARREQPLGILNVRR